MKLQREAEPSPTTTSQKRRIVILAILVAAILACVGFSSSLAFDYAEILDTYWDVHDQVLFPTERGRHFIDLYWAHGRELVQILMEDPEVRREGLALILEFAPPLRALVEGQGSSVVITEDMVRRVDDYLLALHELSGPDLRATIESERAEAAFESLIGLTFEEARMRLVGPPAYPLPGPLPTRFP
jgi:hypothetical protein